MFVHHHTLLQSQGGAARVAHGLLTYLSEQGINVCHSYEVQDNCPGLQLSPQQIASLAATNNRPLVIHHLHASLDWPACLTAFNEAGLTPMITLHDCRLLTGGCAFPLDCEKWKTGCTGNCPQNFLNTAYHWRNTHTLLKKNQPWLITPSNWMAKMIRSVYPDALSRVIANGVASVDANYALSTIRHKKSFGIHPKSKVVLFVAHGGMQAGYKGGHIWKAIWKRIKASEPYAVALAIGGEHLRRNNDFLEFPYLEQKHLTRCMNAADVMVYPSLADNHPLVILEAMACGLPCVAFAVGGIPEQIIHNRTGLLAPAGNAEDLAMLAIRILEQPSFRKYLASQALKRFKTHFTLENMGKGYLEVYSEVLEKRAEI